MTEPSVPAAATVRLDAITRKKIAGYMAENGMSFSQAVRTLVAIALREETETADQAFRAAAFREGVTAGAASLSQHVQDAIKSAMGDMEGL